MNSEQETINLRREENELNLSDLFHIVLANWYWFVLSVLVCAGVAVLYLKWAPKVYTRTASVLIKDNSKGGGLSESAAFEELNMFNATFKLLASFVEKPDNKISPADKGVASKEKDCEASASGNRTAIGDCVYNSSVRNPSFIV